MAVYYAITGTDTDSGKTVLTAGLLRGLHGAGVPVAAVKPVQTGCLPGKDGRLRLPDAEVYICAAPDAPQATLRAYAPACSPHLAARLAGEEIRARDLAAGIRSFSKASRIVLIEGAGGALTPLNDCESLTDVFRLLDARVVIAVPNRVGAINHAILTIEALKSRGLSVEGFVMMQVRPLGDEPITRAVLNDQASAISRMSDVPCLGHVGHKPDLGSDAAWSDTADELRELVATVLATPDKNDDMAKADRLFDAAHIWHPYTSLKDPLPVLFADATQGSRIRLRDGRWLVDGMASWWAAIHGYNHPRLTQALHAQSSRMPHVMFGGLTHEPAVGLARRLLGLAPAGLEHVFYADSGSVAVEVALKMAAQYHMAAGDSRRSMILAPRGGYHGDTLGAMSVGDPQNGMHTRFSGLLPQHVFVEAPRCRLNEPYDPAAAKPLAEAFALHEGRIAAMIVEPVVQGAGGMRFYHPDYLKDAAALCREHGALLILDEIATGFGRTGTMFACERAGVTPDMLCVGKALTGGVMSMAAVMTSRDVAHGVSQDGAVFMHGPTFMGNPLACAVAYASLDLLNASPWRARVGRIEQHLAAGLLPCRQLPGVRDARVCGAIGVLQMSGPVNVQRAQRFFVNRHQVWIRPFSDLIYIMPPYVIEPDELSSLLHAMRAIAEEQAWA